MRYWRVAINAAGAVIVVLFLFSWLTSYFLFDRVSVPLKGRTLVCISYCGQLSAVIVPIEVPKIWWERGDVNVHGNTYPDQLWPRKRIVGFGWITDTLYLNVPNSPEPRALQRSGLTGRSYACNASGLMVPDWFLVLPLVTLILLPWLKPRFSVRSLLVAITLIALLLGILKMANRAPLERHPLEGLERTTS